MKINEVFRYNPKTDELTRSEVMMIIQILKKNRGHDEKIRKLGILMKTLKN